MRVKFRLKLHLIEYLFANIHMCSLQIFFRRLGNRHFFFKSWSWTKQGYELHKTG